MQGQQLPLRLPARIGLDALQDLHAEFDVGIQQHGNPQEVSPERHCAKS